MRSLRTLASLVLLMAAAGAAGAQEKYPSRPIDFVVTWGTGGGADGMARELGSLSQSILGVALPVSNVPGASGNTGLAQVLNGKPDGYAIATYIADTLATIPAGLARHKIEDLEWIARMQVADSFLFVKTDSPFKTIQDLLKHAQANPGKLRVASTGYGSVDDLTVRYLDKRGYKMTTVPYPKPGERYAAALGGHAEVLYEQAPKSGARLLMPRLGEPFEPAIGDDRVMPWWRTVGAVAPAAEPADADSKLASITPWPID